uniref:Uncharacterized protein n=1 Tax=viral metagenome TaxID=1070528 RepID=A0A6H1ZL63_9ZZZZ
MTLDATKPTDEELVSVLPSYIRANRAAINVIESVLGGDVVTPTTLLCPAGITYLSVGVDLSASEIEVVRISASAAITINQIRLGTNGQIKILIFQDSNISLMDGTKLTGQFYLNQLPVGSNFAASVDDVLALINIGGDGISEYGWWKELWRTISVK